VLLFRSIHLYVSRVVPSASLSTAVVQINHIDTELSILSLLSMHDDKNLEERVEALGRLQYYHEEIPPIRVLSHSSVAFLCYRVNTKYHSQVCATLVGSKHSYGEHLVLIHWLNREAIVIINYKNLVDVQHNHSFTHTHFESRQTTRKMVPYWIA